MVFGIRKSNSLPILSERDDEENEEKEEASIVERLDTNRLSTALASDNNKNNKNNDKLELNCKHYSLRRNDNNKLKINTQVFYENIINSNNNNNKSKFDRIESFLSPRINTRKTTKSNQATLQLKNDNDIIINKKSLDPVRSNNLKKINNNKEPISRVIKITEIIEIDNDDLLNKNLTKHELLNKYCFGRNNKETIDYIDMMSPLTSSPDSDTPNTEKQSSTTTTTTTTTTSNETKTDSYLNQFNSSNKTFIKSPSINRKVEVNNNLNRKPHQIHSTTQVKSSDLYEMNAVKPKVHTLKIERETPETVLKKCDKLNGNILQEIMKLTNESLNNIDLAKKQAQSSCASANNTLTRQPIISLQDDEKSIPVVHNFSFVNNDKLSNETKPKRITIKITGRTRSVSTDKKNLINKANLSLGTYRLDEIYSQDTMNNNTNQEQIELRFNDKLIPITSNKYETNDTKNIQTASNSNKFSLDKFKSYFNNINNTNRSYSSPPNERETTNDDSIYGFTKSTPVKTPVRKLEPEVWLETFRPEPDLFEYANRPFQTNQHLSLIKNAGDILNNNNSAFSSINKLDAYNQKGPQPPVWAYRDVEDKRLNSKKNTHLSTFGCGLLNVRPKNANNQFDDRFNINELDYSPSFYSSENQFLNEYNQKNNTNIKLANEELMRFNRNYNHAISNSNNHNESNKINEDERYASLPGTNRSMKKVASYYNDYYKDKNLFINRNKNFSKSYELNPNNVNKLSAKYIDDEDYEDEEDDTSEDYTEGNLNGSLYSNKKLTYLDENIKSASFRVNPSRFNEKNSNLHNSNLNETSASAEGTPRTPKLIRRVIFADEC